MWKKDNWNNRSLHHKIWQCNKSKFYVQIEENKIIITQKLHDAFNMVFNNNQEPRKQFEYLLELTSSVLSEETKNDLIDILSRTDRRFYISKIVK